MLHQGAHNISALLCPTGILDKPLNDSLFHLLTPVPLCIGNLDQTVIDTFDCQGLWLAQSQALAFLCFESNITSIAIFVIEGLQAGVVKAADLFEGF